MENTNYKEIKFENYSPEIVESNLPTVEGKKSFIETGLSWWSNFKIDHKAISKIFGFFGFIFEFLAIVIVVLTITFFLVNSSPGKPSLTASLDPTEAKALEEQYGLTGSAISRYFTYLGGVLKFDFGISLSIFPGETINSFMWQRFATSATVGSIAVVLTLLMGIPLGILVGRSPGKWIDSIATFFIAILISIPTLVFALLILLTGRSMGMPYIYSSTQVITWFLPAFSLALPSIVSYVKYIRTTMNNELKSMHAKFAYLKGTSRNMFIWKHALKPSLFPIATFFPSVILGTFVGGLFTERIFSIPGSGFVMLEASQTKDIYVILFMTAIFSAMTVLSYRLREWLYLLLDPRLRGRG